MSSLSDTPELLYLPPSPFSWRAKWPLDVLGIKYTVSRFDVAPFYALELPLRWRLGNFSGKITAPILFVKNNETGRSRTIMDSTDIVLWAEEKVGSSSSVKFFPPGKEDEVQRWLKVSDDLASFFRRELAQAGTSNSAVIDALLPQESSGMARMFTRFMMGRVFSMIQSKYKDVDADITAEKVITHLKAAREQLSQPNNSGKLLIPEAGLTYADVTMSCMLVKVNMMNTLSVQADAAPAPAPAGEAEAPASAADTTAAGLQESGKVPLAMFCSPEMQQILQDFDDLVKWGYETMERHWGKGKQDI